MDEQNQDVDQQEEGVGAQTTDDLQAQLAAALAEAEKNLNGWKRALADFENYKRRKEEENKELIEFAREVAVAKLLPTLDSLEQALVHSPKLDPSVSATAEPPSLGREGATDSPPAKEEYPVDAGGGGFGQQYKTWLTGIEGLVKQLDKALEELGVKKIEAVGKKFDPNFHEAVREVEGEEGKVVEEYQTGFEINGKVIRPSQVAIGKG